jgi:ABC-type dipeptide/oligopeptide/nickel transport system permease component
VLQGALLLAVLVALLVNLLVDLLYAAIDPRVRGA